MKKRIISLFLVIVLMGCTSVQQIHLKKQVSLDFFYIQTCSQCQAFKKNVIPLLEETFQDDIVIHQYDLDEVSTEEKYDEVIDSLQDFDPEFYGNGPFIVLEGYFALLGYTEGDEDYLIEDIQRAVEGQELSYELEGLRFIYKESLS